MIWDEIDSGHDFLAYTRVSKLLHGGGATEYFQHTKVSVKLMPRKSAAPQVRFCDRNSGVHQTLCHWVILCRVLLYMAASVLLMTRCLCLSVCLSLCLRLMHLCCHSHHSCIYSLSFCSAQPFVKGAYRHKAVQQQLSQSTIMLHK